MKNSISISKEDYLKAVLEAECEGQTVISATLAHWLGVSPPAVSMALRRLKRDGPQTVPKLARIRAVRRQSLQPVVDALASEGLVELLENPAHARSELVALTDRGADLVARMDRVDDRVLRAVGRGLAERDLETTAATLRALRAAFETGMRWRPVVGS